MIVESRHLAVDGLETHILEAGEGPPVVLLHSGEFGASADTTWNPIIPKLASEGYRVLAPDWLGFGRSDKVIDFADPFGRRLRHMAATLAMLQAEKAAIVGCSMGGTLLLRALTVDPPEFDPSVAVVASGGGFVPDNAVRKRLQNYDLTPEGMRAILRTLFYSDALSKDDDYVAWRHALSLEPGAWQCAASAQLRPPGSPQVGFGKVDATPYERIRCPVLVVAGANDLLRNPGYADEFVGRIPDAELLVYEECGHMPNLEQPDRFLADVLDFFSRRYRSGS